jgi:hypothetical protein
LATWRRRGT